MHFFSPVARMPLLEVIPSARTAPGVVSTAVAFGRRMGKTAIVVKDSPGFWVNRILTPYMNEAGHLLAGRGGTATVGVPLREAPVLLRAGHTLLSGGAARAHGHAPPFG